MPLRGPSPVVSLAWLDKQFSQIDKTLSKEFDSLHKEHALILRRINELGEQIQEVLDALDKVPEFISPELQQAIMSVAGTALSIDQKVPDSPSTTKQRKKG